MPSVDKVLIRSLCSLISTGTELKVFCGDFDAGQAADLTIDGLADSIMEYPLRYGYCMVGKLEKNENQQGIDPLDDKLLFVFSPHGTLSLVSRKDVMVVPDGINEEDAVFAPSVETAISLIQDAAPVIGEKVAVVGQGLIGVLTAAILSEMGLDVTVIDVSNDRLNISKTFCGNVKTWNPKVNLSCIDKPCDFDLCIELTGRLSGLQTAVDITGYGGRVLIGSWFSTEEKFRLGTVFHRSHITMKASQVSNIPSKLSARWTKQRRFQLTWDVLKKLKPSKLLIKGVSAERVRFNSKAFENLEELGSTLKEIYSKLEKGHFLTALFDYRDG